MKFDYKNLPKVRILNIVNKGTGEISIEAESKESIYNGRVYLFATDSELIYGKLQFENLKGRFVPDEPQDCNYFEIGREYKFLDDHWGERAQLVLENAKWVKTEFKTKDCYGQRDEKTGQFVLSHPSFKPDANDKSWELIKDAWDHEHCFICWETICDKDCHESTYYVRQEDEQCVCENCYEKYVAKKNWDFEGMNG